YVVTKLPRFAFEKFPGAEGLLGTSMKSVGEAMAIGRSFAESLQKGLRSLETGLSGLDEIEIPGLGQGDDANVLRAALARPTPDRLRIIAEAFRRGLPLEEIRAACDYDPWFLHQIEAIVHAEEEVRRSGLPRNPAGLHRLKALGFSDRRLARLARVTEGKVAELRRKRNVLPVFKRIDTCAAEFEARTPYMYSTYERPLFGEAADEAMPSARRKVMILGGGPNRIGQGIEFDYCCCHAAFALAEAGIETIMVNCNPETVSTDYDTSDRLYFEPLTEEDVLEIVRMEQSRGELMGVIVQYGGQTPLKLARALDARGVPILGTPWDAIDRAEDRERFQALIRKLNLRQPLNAIARSADEIRARAREVGYPLVVRPSNVLGGRAMEIVHDEPHLERAGVMAPEFEFDTQGPVLIDFYLQDAIEVDVDALSDGEEVFVAGILEHIEEAGVHSGDSACALPPHSLSAQAIAELECQTRALALELGVVGLMNVQFAIQNGAIHLIEVNPRASRTVPFVSKAVGYPLARIAARVMAGEKLSAFGLVSRRGDHIAVKESCFPFARFPNVDTVLGPEMRSTGEVMGLDTDFGRAFAKSQLAGGTLVPLEGTAFVSVKDRDKPGLVEPVRRLLALGFHVIATSGTADFLSREGLQVGRINKVLEGRPHVVDVLKNGEVHLVINTTEGAQALADSLSIRRTALLAKVPYYTTLAGGRAAVQAIESLRCGTLEVQPLQSYSK
ncbi:MAG: carbamoyl-phosphate synthase large subunit, partial [Alphaproteobacteria bacterium]